MRATGSKARNHMPTVALVLGLVAAVVATFNGVISISLVSDYAESRKPAEYPQ